MSFTFSDALYNVAHKLRASYMRPLFPIEPDPSMDIRTVAPLLSFSLIMHGSLDCLTFLLMNASTLTSEP